ncbi:MAG: GNAT family N-acetyltransferase [Granulosicoccus sp.]|nr:GNAT family N-acetyltransferase [Granulosicoccus sp.]
MSESIPLPRICERTVLRQFLDSDLARFQAYRSDPELALFQDWEQMSDRDALSFIQHQRTAEFLVPGHWYQIAIADRSSGVLIGDIGIRVDPDEQEAEIGFTMAPAHQKKGLCSESMREVIYLIFEHTRVASIVGVTDARNRASVNLLKALGLEQVKSMDTVFRGEPCTELIFTALRNRIFP